MPTPRAAPPGWYPDPVVHAGSRYWDGSAWLPSPGWYDDPEHPGQQRWWNGAAWTPPGAPPQPPPSAVVPARRPPVPVLVQVGAPVAFTLLGIATGMTLWPAGGASCHTHPPPAYPFGVTLSLWVAGVVLGIVLVAVSYWRWRRIGVPLLILLGAVVLPLLVAVIGSEDCLA